MGVYFNPNNESFTGDKKSKIYIDKTGLLEYLNEILGTSSRYLAVSHARRFGKSHAAGMIDAYYSLGCDSSNLFDDTNIGTFDVFIDHGKTNQVWLQGFTGDGVSKECGKFLIDFNKKGVHNVKIQITSSNKPVKIRGIIAI